MRFDVDLPKRYDYSIPMFEKGLITERVRSGLENLLFVYVGLTKKLAETTSNNLHNYRITEVFIVGSGAKENIIDSDMDLFLITPGLEAMDRIQLKGILSLVFFTDRSKIQAVDPYIGGSREDLYKGRARVDITSQVQEILDKYNSELT